MQREEETWQVQCAKDVPVGDLQSHPPGVASTNGRGRDPRRWEKRELMSMMTDDVSGQPLQPEPGEGGRESTSCSSSATRG